MELRLQENVQQSEKKASHLVRMWLSLSCYKYAKNLLLCTFLLCTFFFFFFVMTHLLETSCISVGGELYGAEATGMIDCYQ